MYNSLETTLRDASEEELAERRTQLVVSTAGGSNRAIAIEVMMVVCLHQLSVYKLL